MTSKYHIHTEAVEKLAKTRKGEQAVRKKPPIHERLAAISAAAPPGTWESMREPAMVAAHKAGRTVARLERDLQTLRNIYATLEERTAFDAGYFGELRRERESKP